MLDIVTFDSGVEGKSLLILGGVHGSEPCGPIAISKIVEQFQDGHFSLKKGSVTFVPMCNPKAYQKSTRYIDRDLNRYMSPIKSPKLYEDDLTNALCPLLERTDVLLDIHSYNAGGVPFAFIQSPDSTEVAFAKASGVEHMVYGFQNAYKNVAVTDFDEATKKSMGTTEYMRQFGGVGFTLECGKNGSQESIEIAERAILNGMGYLGMIDRELTVSSDVSIVEIEEVYSRSEGETFVADKTVNFASISSGERITTHVSSSKDSVIVLPDTNADVGEEWFYLGRQIK